MNETSERRALRELVEVIDKHTYQSVPKTTRLLVVTEPEIVSALQEARTVLGLKVLR